MNKKSKTQSLLEGAAPQAVQVLCEVLGDDSLPRPLRVDVAKDVLNRAYGKSAPAEKEEPISYSIEISDSAKELSK